jgi:hypothetical protein
MTISTHGKDSTMVNPNHGQNGANKRKRRKPLEERKSAAQKAVDTANTRIAGMIAIDKSRKLSLGGPVTTMAVTAARDVLLSHMNDSKNLKTAQAKAKMAVLRQTKVVRSFCTRVLKLVSGRYGDDSEEYKQVGGTPTSQRRRPRRTARQPPQAISDSQAATAPMQIPASIAINGTQGGGSTTS